MNRTSKSGYVAFRPKCDDSPAWGVGRYEARTAYYKQGGQKSHDFPVRVCPFLSAPLEVQRRVVVEKLEDAAAHIRSSGEILGADALVIPDASKKLLIALQLYELCPGFWGLVRASGEPLYIHWSPHRAFEVLSRRNET